MTRRSGSPKDGVRTEPSPNAMDHAVQRKPTDIPAILRFWLFYRQPGRATTFSSKFERKSMLGKFLRDESGATAIEYSLIAGFIALAIIAAVGMTGERLIELFESLIPALTL
jgi:pilus assembly protein Flp/PilA